VASGAVGAVVADTDLVIDFLRGRGAGASAIPRWRRERRLRLTAVTAFELRVGTDFLDRRLSIERLLTRGSLRLDRAAALYAGAAYATLRRDGLAIGVLDCLQAGICLRYDLPLATRNVRHFERVVGLRLADPSD
jgi:tRNA(fMet)-specific endonuclease VapC